MTTLNGSLAVLVDNTPNEAAFDALDVRITALEQAPPQQFSGTLDDVPDGASFVRMTPSERSKLSGIEDGAQVNEVTTAQLDAVAADVATKATQAGLDATNGAVDANSAEIVVNAAAIAGKASQAGLDAATAAISANAAAVAANTAKLSGIEAGAQVNTVLSVNGMTGDVVVSGGTGTGTGEGLDALSFRTDGNFTIGNDANLYRIDNTVALTVTLPAHASVNRKVVAFSIAGPAVSFAGVAGGGSPPAVDNLTSFPALAHGAASRTVSYTHTGGDLLVMLATRHSGQTVTSVTFGGVAFNLVNGVSGGTGAGQCRASAYRGAIGAQTANLVVTYSAAVNGDELFALSVVGAAAAPVDSSGVFSSNGSGALTTAYARIVANTLTVMLAARATGSTAASFSPAGGLTEIAEPAFLANCVQASLNTQAETAAGSLTRTVNGTLATAAEAAVSVSYAPSTGSGGSTIKGGNFTMADGSVTEPKFACFAKSNVSNEWLVVGPHERA